MADPTGPINVSSMNVQQATVGTVRRGPIMRQDVNTGDAKTDSSETVILTDINETMSKVDDTIREYLGRIEDFIKDILDQGKPKQARPKEKIEPPEGPKSERDEYAVMVRMEQLLKGLNDHAELQRIEAETAQAERDGKRKAQANFDDRAQLTHRQEHYKTIGSIYKKHQTQVLALSKAYQAGTISFTKFMSGVTQIGVSYTIQKTAANSLHVTMNRLRQGFASLTAGVDGVALMMNAAKERYNADGGYKTMVQSGYGGIYEAYLADIIPNISRDSMFQTSKLIRENLKADPSNEILTGGRSLETASRQIYQAQVGVKDQGYALLDRMTNAEQKAALTELAGTMKRSNTIADINSATATSLMTAQLKEMQIAAANTGATVTEVRKNTEAQRKKVADFSAAGILTKQQEQFTKNLLSQVHNNDKLKELFTQMAQSGWNPAIFMSQNEEAMTALQSLGGNVLGDVMQMMNRVEDGTITERDFLTQFRDTVKAAQESGNFSRMDQGAAASKRIDPSGIIGAINQLGDRPAGVVDPNEKTLFGYINRVQKFFEDTIAGDLLKGIGGLGLTIFAASGIITGAVTRLGFVQVSLTKAVIANTAALWATMRGGIANLAGKGKAGAAAAAAGKTGIRGKIAGLAGGAAGIATGMGDLLSSALAGVTTLGAGLWQKFRGKEDSPISAGDQTARERTKPHYKMKRGPNGEVTWERAGGPDPKPDVKPGGSVPPSPSPDVAPPAKGGKVGGFLKGMGSTLLKGVGPAAILGSLALPVVDSITPEFKGKDTLMSGAQGAMMGAMVGSIIPGLGTALGAALGGGIGMLMPNLSLEAKADERGTPSVAPPPQSGWTPVVAALDGGFNRSIDATQQVTMAVADVRDVLVKIQHSLDKGGGIVRSRIDQATMTPMVPGARLF